MWTMEIFKIASSGNLKMEDLYRPAKCEESEILSNCLEREWNREVENANRTRYKTRKLGLKTHMWTLTSRPSLKRALFRAFLWQNCVLGIFQLILAVGIRIFQPIFQRWIINHYKLNSNTTKNDALYYATGLILSIIVMVFLWQHTFNMGLRIGMRARIACSSLIYSKVLRLHKSVVGKTAAGQVINLMSNDVSRFDYLPVFLNYIWIMPLQVLVGGYFMWQLAKVAAIIGIIVFILITLPVQIISSNISNTIRVKIALMTDKRVQLMHELIAGIQVVKMYAWESPFQKLVANIRVREMKEIIKACYIFAINNSSIEIAGRVSLFVTIVISVAQGYSLTAEVAFTLALYFTVLQFSLAILVPIGLILYGQADASIQRIQEFLLLEELSISRQNMIADSQPSTVNKALASTELILKPIGDNYQRDQSLRKKSVKIELRNVSANWNIKQSPATLCNISTTIEPGHLCAVAGSVGSGKTAILNILLKELHLESGEVIFNQTNINRMGAGTNGYYADDPNIRISYASQEPWLFSGTVRENILFGQLFDKTRYNEVTEVCALTRDFQLFPHGDETVVGERGASLSGGQRARINLARAVYVDADLYLFDDPLSAVDTHVGEHLFGKCILNYLREKTRILVTHQLQYLQRVDKILIIEQGSIKHQGSFRELNQICFNLPTTSTNQSEDQEGNQENKEDFHKLSSPDELKDVPRRETKSDSSMSMDQPRQKNSQNEEELEQGKVSSDVYWSYLKAGGTLFSIISFAIVVICSQLSIIGADYWICYWTSIEELSSLYNSTTDGNRNVTDDKLHEILKRFGGQVMFSSNTSSYIYSGCIIAVIILCCMRNYLLLNIGSRASKNLHNLMFGNVGNTSMFFFNTNPSGRILNRFSKDIGTIDERLPTIMMETLQIGLTIIAILILLCIINYYTIIPLVLAGLPFYYMLNCYRNTIQALKRLEGVAKSPIFSHVNTTMNGLTTIRSSGVYVDQLRKQFHEYQNIHTSAWHLITAVGTAFGLFADLLCCALVAFVIFCLILMFDTGDILGSGVGLANWEAMMIMAHFTYGLKQAAEFLAHITSVERVLAYTKLPCEHPESSSISIPSNWPAKGHLVLRHVSMAYKKDKPLVLKDLNVIIEEGWKVGVVGRTGAGKSSLITALYRLTDGLTGKIIIDRIDTRLVGLKELRSRISIIPQEPVLFAEKLRFNLDPFGQYNDDKLLEALSEVELGNISLDKMVAERGNNFSVGQRQLVCLARAILRNNRILILDEATANIDAHTESLIQKTIRSTFSSCTILTIAHRLHTIMDNDRIIVMDAGQIVEFGSPYELLTDKPNGVFVGMVNRTGKTTAEKLYKIAESVYFRNAAGRNVEIVPKNN